MFSGTPIPLRVIAPPACGLMEPPYCLGSVFRDALSAIAAVPEVVVRARVPLLYGPVISLHARRLILNHASTYEGNGVTHMDGSGPHIIPLGPAVEW